MRRALATLLAVSLVAVGPLALSRGAEASAPLARVGLAEGWNTFGLVLPPGKAFAGLKVADLPAQADIKTVWPDQSIRFAVVTAHVAQADHYPVTAGAAYTGTFEPKCPEAAVRFQIGSDTYTAALPPQPTKDLWLSGPLVTDWRAVVTPTRSDGTPHPLLRVYFDTRAYKDGKSRVDLTVENTLDVQGGKRVTYALDLLLGKENLLHRDKVYHFWLTRWRQICSQDLSGSWVKPDFEPFVQARALPRYVPTVSKQLYPARGPAFDLLGGGGVHAEMSEHGGRPELAPYPDWTARYLVHRTPELGHYVLLHGDLAGSWPVHVREADGRPVSIDEHPNYWLDERADSDGRPKGILDRNATGPLRPDNAHVPSLAYVPYLATGDRFYADEMKFWANYGLLSTWQDHVYNRRAGSQGLLYENQVRGFAWVLRNLVDAAAYLPDADPLKRYFADKIGNNLRWLDENAANHPTPLGTLWETKRPENQNRIPFVWIALWEQNYLAWSIDHANQQGFRGGLKHRDQIARFQLGLLTSPRFPRAYGCPYVLAVGERDDDGQVQYYKDFGDIFKHTFPPDGKPTSIAGYYGVDARLSLLIAVQNHWAGARGAYDYVNRAVGVVPHMDGLPDMCRRSGWAIALEEAAGPVGKGREPMP